MFLDKLIASFVSPSLIVASYSNVILTSISERNLSPLAISHLINSATVGDALITLIGINGISVLLFTPTRVILITSIMNYWTNKK